MNVPRLKPLLLACLWSATTPASEALIAFNNLGYQPNAAKTFCTDQSADWFEIQNPSGDAVFRGSLIRRGLDALVGAEVWTGDFAALKTPGRYTIMLADGSRSQTFQISQKVYDDLLPTVTRGLYVSRCGYAVDDSHVGHPPCHLGQAATMLRDGKKIPTDMNGDGGWHNGGDYWRSSMAAAQTISRLLGPLDWQRGIFKTSPITLPGSERRGDESDILTEVRWGLEWLLKMQFPDGGVSIGISPAIFTMPRFTTAPQDDTVEHFLGAANSSHTAKAGAVFAKAARVLRKSDPELSERCLKAALSAYSFLQAHPEMVNPDTIEVYGSERDDFDRLWIAVELYRATGEDIYHQDFLKRYAGLPNPYPKANINTHTIRNYNLHEALISYCFIEGTTDPKVRGGIRNGLLNDCDLMVARSEQSAYASVLEDAHWRQRHTIGNALQMAWELTMAEKLTGKPRYGEVAMAQLHYVLGANPLGKTFITGVGHNPITRPHYRPFSIRGSAPPGLTVKGPTLDAKFLAEFFPDATPPPMKAYVDKETAHSCNEPDIEVQAHLIALVAWAVAKGAAGN